MQLLMTAPVIVLPAQFRGSTLSQVARDVVRHVDDKHNWPEAITFDFSRLNFIHPAGVVFLSNLVYWLNEKGTAVSFTNCDVSRDAIGYLDDSLFFEQHCRKKLSSYSAPRSTTRPLQRIAQKDSHAWLETDFVPWLAAQLGITQPSLYTFKACVSELFNNIQDHTRYDIGSIFIQYFPKKNLITISLSDFGLGIPLKVREKLPNLSDDEAISASSSRRIYHKIETRQQRSRIRLSS